MCLTEKLFSVFLECLFNAMVDRKYFLLSTTARATISARKETCGSVKTATGYNSFGCRPIRQSTMQSKEFGKPQENLQRITGFTKPWRNEMRHYEILSQCFKQNLDSLQPTSPDSNDRHSMRFCIVEIGVLRTGLNLQFSVVGTLSPDRPDIRPVLWS